MKRARIGDVVEIKTSKGLAYALYTHKHQRYGALLRVFGRLHQIRPTDLQEVVRGDVRFSVFFPLNAALKLTIVAIAGNVAMVPEKLTQFPIFRAGAPHPATGRVKTWWLWDGENEWPIGQLTQEQRRLPIRGVVNDTLLIQWIESGWRPEDET